MDRKKGRLIFHRVINERSGFTLAELLLVVGIIVILTGVSVMAASYYFRVLKLNEMDNTAKQIFIAAQNHLTSAQSTGELDRYMKSDEVKNNVANPGDAGYVDVRSDERALGVLMDYKPSDVNDTSLDWPEPNEEFYYIYHDANADGTDEGINNSVLKYALPKNAIDDYVNTEGKYIIEYDIKTASVYGVFYTEKKNELNRDTIVNDFNKVGDGNGRGGSNDAKNVRRNHEYNGENQIIGYYGGAMAEQWMAQNQQLELSVKNGADPDLQGWEEEPNASVTYNDEQLIAIIRDYGNTNTDRISLQVHGKTSGNDAFVSLNLKNNSLGIALNNGTKKIYQIDCGLDGPISDRETFGSVNVINANSKDECREYQIVLDDLVDESDVGSQIHNCHFAYLFPTLIPGEDIELTAYSYQNDCATGRSDNSYVVNSLFGKTDTISTTETVTKKSAEISSFRHLENMDIDNMSGLMTYGTQYDYGNKYKLEGSEIVRTSDSGFDVSNQNSGTINYVFTNFKQTADLDWDENEANYKDKTLCGVNKVSVSGKYSAQTNSMALYLPENENKTNGGNVVHPGSFKSIRSKDMLEYDGNNKKISNVKIRTNIVVSTSNTDNRSNGGLFAYLEQNNSMKANCSIHDLSLIEFDVTAPKNVAALISESAINSSYELQIDKVLIDKGSLISQYKYDNANPSDGSNKGNAGALVGYCGSKVVVNKCASSATVKATGDGYYESSGIHYGAADVGGLIGEVRKYVTITDSYTGGTTDSVGNYNTDADKYNIIGTYTAGGLLGRASSDCRIAIDNCYSTCSVYSSFSGLSGGEKVPAKAGGLIGLQEGGTATIDNSYSTGKIWGPWDSHGWVKDDNHTIKGAIIGYSTGTSTFDDSYYLRGDNESPLQFFNSYPFLKAIGIYNPTVLLSYNYKYCSEDKDGVEARTFDDMLTGYNKETHSINRAGKYPFRVVNKTGMADNGKNGVHYGDWPKAREYVKETKYDDLLFAYKEVIDPDGNGNQKAKTYWYVENKDNKGNYKVELNTLPTKKDVYLNDTDDEGNITWSYGFLCPKYYSYIMSDGSVDERLITSLGTYFQGGGNNQSAVNLRDNQTYDKDDIDVNVNNESYSFWKYRPTNGNNADIVTTPTQQQGNTATRFQFNNKFAAAITTSNKNDLGTSNNKYQIRNVKQLESVKESSNNNANDYVDGKNYAQTLDIDLGLASTTTNNPYKFSPIGTRTTPFTGTYTGIVSNQGTETGKDNSHTIKNFYQEVTGTNNLAGLFGRVTGTGTKPSSITNVNIEGSTIDDSNRGNDIVVSSSSGNNSGPMHIGGLVSLSEGTVRIQDCSANLAIATSNGDNTFTLPNDIVFIGGMFGNISTGGEATGCSFDGKVSLNVGSIGGASTRIRAGGFAGGSAGNLNKNNANANPFTVGSESAPVELKIILPSGGDTMVSTRNDRIGGAVGEFQGSLFANCTSYANVNYDTAKSRYAYIGGVLGYWQANRISLCSHTGNINVNNTNNDINLLNGSKIGKLFGGTNDYASTDINEMTINNGVITYKGGDIKDLCGGSPNFIPYPDFTPAPAP